MILLTFQRQSISLTISMPLKEAEGTTSYVVLFIRSTYVRNEGHEMLSNGQGSPNACRAVGRETAAPQT